MADVWIVLIEDRHADVEALPFSTENAARRYAWDAAGANASSPSDVGWEADLTPAMVRAGWVMFLPYGSESDCVRVVRREMDGGVAGD